MKSNETTSPPSFSLYSLTFRASSLAAIFSSFSFSAFLVARGAALGPWPPRTVGRESVSWALLGPIFRIFGVLGEVSTNPVFWASLQKAKNRRINGPGTSLERFLDRFSSILGQFWIDFRLIVGRC